MGNFTKATGADAHYGNHSMQTNTVFNAVEGAVDPTATIQWQTQGPKVLQTPERCSMQEADAAEQEAFEFREGVKHGLRRLAAEARKQLDQARLVKGHRRYLKTTSLAHLSITQANGALGEHLHGLREKYAELGFGFDRKAEQMTSAVDRVSQKYKGIVNAAASVRK
jgi:hypothetical protein